MSLLKHAASLRRPFRVSTYPKLITARYSQKAPKPPTPKVDFLAVETAWQAKWDATRTKIQEDRTIGEQRIRIHDNPLKPFYLDHIHRWTVLSECQRIMKKGQLAEAQGINIEKKNMIEHIIFTFGLPSSNLPMDRFDPYITEYGSDLVRAALIINPRRDANGQLCVTEDSIQATKKWMAQVWRAVGAAHNAYNVAEHYNSGSRLGVVDFEAPNKLDKSATDILREIEHLKLYVHIPPPYPTLRQMESNQEMALWLGIQELILMVNHKSKSVNPQELQPCLDPLITMVAEVDILSQLHYIKHDILYHSIRTILSIIAVFVPSFAEECWVALHYGNEHWHSDIPAAERALSFRKNPGVPSPAMRRKLREYGMHDLPREGQPDSLSSIFAQPFPTVDQPSVVEHLRKYASEGAFNSDFK